MLIVFFVAVLILCGALDYKYKAVPLWCIILLNILGIGMCALQHPFLSVLAALTVLIFCLCVRMGAADKMIFPIVAGSFGLSGVLLVMTTVIVSLSIIRLQRKTVPAVSILTLFFIIFFALGLIET